MAREGVAQGFAAAFLGAFQNKYLGLLVLDILMLISGMFCDDIILLLVVIPLVMPLTSQMGVNIVQIGAIIVLTVGMGKVTPTWAFSSFVGSQLADVPYE